MLRPNFKSYKYAADPRRAYSDAMKNYLVYLEENQAGDTNRELRYMRDEHLKNYWHKEAQNIELRKTLKILRSQIKTMWKENNAD